jgi:hypothetical protein
MRLLDTLQPHFVKVPLARRSAGQQAEFQTAGGASRLENPDAEYPAAHTRLVTALSSHCDKSDCRFYSMFCEEVANFRFRFYEQ